MSEQRRYGAIFCGIFLAVAAALMAAAPVAGASRIPVTAQQLRTCVFDLDQQRLVQCYTRDDAVSPANAGEVTAQDSAAADDKGKIIVGKFWDGRNYAGEQYVIMAKKLCNPADGIINSSFSFPDFYWNKVTSVESYGNCKIWLYPQTKLKGQRDGPFEGNIPFVGNFMNNRTKSVGFS